MNFLIVDFFVDGAWHADSNYNASGDTTAPGANSVINRITLDEFENAAGFLPFLKAGNTIETLGLDVTSQGVTNDIEGKPYTGWPIGCHQPGAFTVPVSITALDAETLTPIVGVDIYVYADTGGSLPAGTEITSGTTDANGKINTTPEFTTNQPMVVQGRKGSASPFYNQGRSLGTITGDGFTGNVYMVTDE